MARNKMKRGLNKVNRALNKMKVHFNIVNV